MTKPVLELRVDLTSLSPPASAYCASFDGGKWRMKPLVDDVFNRHLTSFALSFTPYDSIDGDSAAEALANAARSVYSTDKYQSRGEFGELFLHAILRDFYGAVPAVSKIFYKDSPNDTVKGFDSVHLVEGDEGIELWLGEVKFYSSLSSAISSVTTELSAHSKKKYLRREFVAITNKLDPAWKFSDEVRDLLHRNRTLDSIVDSLVIPVMLTYNSAAVRGSTVVGQAYIEALQAELQGAWDRIVGAIKLKKKLRLVVILLPLNDKKKLVKYMHKKLLHWKAISGED